MFDKLQGLSMDIAAAEQDKLHALFPLCFMESKLEFLQIAGKRSAGTLRP